MGGRVEEDDEAAEVDRPANMVERFDPATNVWQEVAPMVTVRHSPCVAVLFVVATATSLCLPQQACALASRSKPRADLFRGRHLPPSENSENKF